MTFFGNENIPEPRQHENQNTNHPIVYLGPGEVLYGTFFVIPVDAGAEPEPQPTKPAKPQPVIALPDTGAGAVVETEETEKLFDPRPDPGRRPGRRRPGRGRPQADGLTDD